MSMHRFATLLGAVLCLFGVLGFVPPLLTPGIEVHPLSIDTPHDLLFRLFPCVQFGARKDRVRAAKNN